MCVRGYLMDRNPRDPSLPSNPNASTNIMPGNNNLLEVTDANFASEIEGGEGLQVVDFWAEWCGPCRLLGPIVEELASDYADEAVRVGKLDVDANPKTAARFNVLSIPSILFFEGGELVERVVGLVPKQNLANIIDKHL